MQMELGTELTSEKPSGEVDFGDTGAEHGMVRFFLGVGRMHKVAPKDIVGAIPGETGIYGKAIGAIRILDSYSFVEVPKRECRGSLHHHEGPDDPQPAHGIEPASGKRA